MSAGRDYDLHEQEISVKKDERILLTSDGFHLKPLRRRISVLSSLNLVFVGFRAVPVEAISVETLDDGASCLVMELE